MKYIPISCVRVACSVFRFSTQRVARWYFRSYPENAYVAIPFFGFRFPVRVARTDSHKVFCLEGERYLPETGLIGRTLHAGETVVDVGANIGYYALYFRSLVGPTGRVICIEPEPDNLVELAECVRANGFTNVEILRAAAGSHSGELALDTGMNGNVRTDPSPTSISVRVVCLNDFAGVKPKWVKIDIEGYEAAALDGAADLIRQVRPGLFIEVHPQLLGKYGESVRGVIDRLKPSYPTMEFHSPIPRRPLVKYLLSKYGIAAQIRSLGGADDVISRAESGELTDPFWLVCPPGTPVNGQ